MGETLLVARRLLYSSPIEKMEKSQNCGGERTKTTCQFPCGFCQGAQQHAVSVELFQGHHLDKSFELLLGQKRRDDKNDIGMA